MQCCNINKHQLKDSVIIMFTLQVVTLISSVFAGAVRGQITTVPSTESPRTTAEPTPATTDLPLLTLGVASVPSALPLVPSALKSANSLMLPYVLKSPKYHSVKQYDDEQDQDHKKHFKLLTKTSPIDDKEQAQLALASKIHKPSNWDRHAAAEYFYPPLSHIYPWRLPHAHYYDSTTTSNQLCCSPEPANVVLFLNIGVLVYVLVAVVGLTNRMHQMSTEYLSHGHFYYKKGHGNEDAHPNVGWE